MATGEYHHGQRRSYAGALCTVRHFGPLPNAKGEWLGVEWDDPTRGKHDGQHQGRRVFRCLSSSPTAASFLRPSRKPDPERTLLEAIKFKYAPSSVPGRNDVNDAIEISGKVVEEVGFDRIQQQLSVLADLKIVLVDELVVSGIAPRGASQEDIRQAQQDLAQTCPNITELDLGWNVIETWQDVLDMCAPLPKLKILKAGGLRLREFRARVPREHPLRNIDELHLNENLLTPDQIIEILFFARHCNFESLRTLALSLNELASLDFDDSAGVDDDGDWRRCPSVTSVILDNNNFTSLAFLPTLFGLFPSLTSLSLPGNAVSALGLDSSASFPTLETLNLAGNRIQEYSFIDRLPILFPNLTSLRISRNRLYEPGNVQDEGGDDRRSQAPGTSTSDSTSYYLTLARIPGLKSLNYTTIMPRDREEGEIYYLSVAEREIKTILAGSDQAPGATGTGMGTTTHNLSRARQRHPLYSTLCAKYDRDDLLQIYTQTARSSAPPTSPLPADGPESHKNYTDYAPGTLGARLVDAYFYIPPSASPPTTTDPGSSAGATPSPRQPLRRLLPTTISVFRLKSLVARHFGLPALRFALVYESHEYDPIEPIHSTRNTGVGTWGKESWDGWGDWDVDQSDDSDEEEREEQKTTENPPLPLRGGDVGVNEDEGADAQAPTPTFVVREGHRFKKRETLILDGMRPWGDFLDVDGPAPAPAPVPASGPGQTRRRARDVRVRVEVV
ncbi:hypothetical protein A1O7_06266 [Cladophialophora yegresii CBS 114405]|uniref:CAP-Gly domain-containing protein n=1 Tax=Cladophialophora yegresii CBS 114405 TaxID=1182544 RepID=W9W2U5_9EURO|nr:uncharacterized protein A1O7_06266 [Cladophialophora yegresii CBS 114405]EXJ58836.1 hypothetical protein A1O7_06266 [Cladophialophora yegresii CBS 114405]